MSNLYDRQRAGAARLLKKFGQLMVVTHRGASVYDPATSTMTATSITTPAHGVVSEVSEREIDGTNVLRGDKKVTLAAVAGMPTPTVGDSIAIQGIAYSVESSAPLAPSGSAVIHQLRVRA